MSTQATDQDTEQIRRQDHARSTDRDTRLATRPGRDRHSAFNRQKDEFGGVKIGSAFFGWLTATGTALLLTAFVAAAGTAIAVATDTDPRRLTSQAAAQDPRTAAITGAVVLVLVVLVLVLFVAYYCGGYVAGRMARFNGLTQGMAVWLWAVVIVSLVTIMVAVAGGQFDVLSQLNSFPRMPVSERDLTTGGSIALVLIAVGSLAGSLLGGLAGMRFHRQVDRAGLSS